MMFWLLRLVRIRPEAGSKAPSSKGGKTKEAFFAVKKVEMEKKGKAYDQAKLDKLFDKMDANQDGIVTREEQKAYYEKK